MFFFTPRQNVKYFFWLIIILFIAAVLGSIGKATDVTGLYAAGGITAALASVLFFLPLLYFLAKFLVTNSKNV